MDRDLTQWAASLDETWIEFVYPPDLTSRRLNVETCWARYPGRLFTCTRRTGHTGRHAAGTGAHIVAVWP